MKKAMKPLLVVLILFAVMFSASQILGWWKDQMRYTVKLPSVQAFMKSERKSYPTITSILFYTEMHTKKPRCTVYGARLSEAEVCRIVLDVRDLLNSAEFRQELRTFRDWDFSESFCLQFPGFYDPYGEYLFTCGCDEDHQYLNWRGAFYLAESEIGQTDVFYYITEHGEIVTQEYNMESIENLAENRK